MATTKEQLIAYFQSLDIPTLEKLKKYSELLIIPEEDLLVNATMTQMVSKAHSLADSLFPSWTDRSKSDFGEFLVELFALFSEKDFWYLNAFANEGILSKMHSYSNAFSRASSMGYYPTTCKGAKSTFTITFSAGAKAVCSRGDLVVRIGEYTFSNDSDITILESNSSTIVQADLYEGSQLAEDVIYNGNNIFLSKDNIDVSSIQVSIGDVSYTRVNNFGNSSEYSQHFLVLPEENGACSIHFGRDGFGEQPIVGTPIHVEYRTCNGSKGNLPVSPSDYYDCSVRNIENVDMLVPSEGGSYGESLTAIKERAALFYRSKKAIINEEIGQEILNSLSFVKRSKVILDGHTVTYRVIPLSGLLEPSASEQSMLEEEFCPYLMLGYQGFYATNSYKNLMLSANLMASKVILDVIVLSGYNLTIVESSIRQIMNELTNPLVSADYGGSFSKTSTDIIIRTKVNGVQSVTFKLKVGTDEVIMPDVQLKEYEIFSPINQDDLIIRTNVV